MHVTLFNRRSTFRAIAFVCLALPIGRVVAEEPVTNTLPSTGAESIESLRAEIAALRAENAALRKELAGTRENLTTTTEKLNTTTEQLSTTSAKLEEAATRPAVKPALPNPFARGMSTAEVRAICDAKGWTFAVRDIGSGTGRGLIPGVRKSRGAITLPNGERALMDFRDDRMTVVGRSSDDPYPF